MPTANPAIRLAAPRTADYAMLVRAIDELEENARFAAKIGSYNSSNDWCPNTVAQPPAQAPSLRQEAKPFTRARSERNPAVVLNKVKNPRTAI